MWLVSLCAMVLSFASVNHADDLFNFPPAPGSNMNFVADLPWKIGSTQNIQWSTTLDAYSIALWQQTLGQASGTQLNNVYSIDSDGSGQQSCNWEVQTYDSSLSTSPVYFLWLTPSSPQGDNQGFTSHYFNITDQAASSSSSSLSSSTSTTSSSSTSSTSSTSLTTSMTTTSTSSTSSQQTSKTVPASTSNTNTSTDTVKVGLGVGLGIGIPLVLIAGIWIGLKTVKQRQSFSHATGSGVPLSHFSDRGYPPDPYLPPKESNYYPHLNREAPRNSPEYHEAPVEGALIELGPREP